MKIREDSVVSIIGGGLLTVVFAIVATAAVSMPASATVQFAKDTGKSCAACHVAAAGGGPLTPYGSKFQANGNKMPK